SRAAREPGRAPLADRRDLDAAVRCSGVPGGEDLGPLVREGLPLPREGAPRAPAPARRVRADGGRAHAPLAARPRRSEPRGDPALRRGAAPLPAERGVRCAHHPGAKGRAAAEEQVIEGSLFELVERARDFVMSRLSSPATARTRASKARAGELPSGAVTEAIVNALTHRDHASAGSVQVDLFPDRLEVRNPGELPPSLSADDLRQPHVSIPRNPLLAEPFFLARYSESPGTGTLDMLELCRAAGLREPEFRS